MSWLLLLAGASLVASPGHRSTTAAEDPPVTGAARTATGLAVAEAARYFLERGRHPGRDDCSGLVESVLARVGIVARGGVRTFWRAEQSEGRAFREPRPAPGDLVFFDRTYDANGNGRVDDALTHVGIVIAVERDGTLTIVHRSTAKGITILRMNLRYPSQHRREGQLLNGFLRSPRYGGANAPRLAGELWRGFARVGSAPATVARKSVGPPSEIASASPLTNQIVRGRDLESNRLRKKSCDELWFLRNAVYARHGYVFSTPRAKRVFGALPWYKRVPGIDRSSASAHLTAIDRRNLGAIRDREKARGCRRVGG